MLCKGTVSGFILAALAAGSLTLPAVAAQSTTHKKAHKSTASHSGSTSLSASNTNAATTKTTKSSARSTRSSRSSSRRTRKVKGQAAPTPERINEIQEALAKNGAYAGAPSGKWDDSTADAMRKFQVLHGLNPTGKLDAPTLQKLGFGSETAGLGAPTPPPNSVANRLLSPAAKRDEAKEQTDPQ